MNKRLDRKRMRLKDFDYSADGAYFITICTKDKQHFFGDIKNDKMILNSIGNVAEKCWQEIPDHFPDSEIGEYVIMPNHAHGIIWIKNGFVGNENFHSLPAENTHLHSPRGAKSRSLSSIVRGFKIGVTKWCRTNGHENFAWQSSFHDRIIRDELELNRIREYIQNNPLNWVLDEENRKI